MINIINYKKKKKINVCLPGSERTVLLLCGTGKQKKLIEYSRRCQEYISFSSIAATALISDDYLLKGSRHISGILAITHFPLQCFLDNSQNKLSKTRLTFLQHTRYGKLFSSPRCMLKNVVSSPQSPCTELQLLYVQIAHCFLNVLLLVFPPCRSSFMSSHLPFLLSLHAEIIYPSGSAQIQNCNLS